MIDSQVSCTHCHLPVPSGLLEDNSEQQFCCNGCRTVWNAIHQGGLESYYQMRDLPQQPASHSGRGFEEFDHEEWQQSNVRIFGEMAEVEFQLEGVHCAACVWLVEKLPTLVPGVQASRLDFGRSRLSLRYLKTIPLSTIAKCLDQLGYPPHPAYGIEAEEARRTEDRRQLTQIAVAGALAGNVMAIAFALYGGIIHGMESSWHEFFLWASFALTSLSVFWPGRVFFKGAWAAIRTRTSHMDLPIAIGLGAGYLGGAWNTFNGHGEVYFESVCILIFLLLVGRFVQQRQQRRAWNAVELLHALTPGRARRVKVDGSVVEIPISTLIAGDIVEVRAGESIPADGELIEGESEFDLSLLSGESRPEKSLTGDYLHAGTINLRSSVKVRVEKTGEETRVGRLMNLVERHARLKAPVVRLADRISGWFVVVVLFLAVVCFSYWWTHDQSQALKHTIALLIVACPCALGLATPLAVAAAVGKAAQEGILVKGGEALERISKPGLMLLDKTGTLTEGKVSVVEVLGNQQVLPLAVALENHSAHLHAQALAAKFPSDKSAGEVEEKFGFGICGVVDGKKVKVGSSTYLSEQITPQSQEWVNSLSKRALTPVLISVNNQIESIVGFGDAIKADAKSSLAKIQGHGWELAVLSGDHVEVVNSVVKQLGISPQNCHGQVAPEEKLEKVREACLADKSRPVVMVGDGVNDAAALVAADVGIAVHGGAEASLAAADVFLAHSGTDALWQFVRGARRTMGIIRRGLWVSLAYNALGVSLAIAGYLNPLWAAVLMPVSSLTVVSLAWRSKSF